MGVVKRGRGLHFMVNGSVLSAAEEALPPNSKVGGACRFDVFNSDISTRRKESNQINFLYRFGH